MRVRGSSTGVQMPIASSLPALRRRCARSRHAADRDAGPRRSRTAGRSRSTAPGCATPSRPGPARRRRWRAGSAPASAMRLGIACITVGSTKNKPTTAVMPPAVLRMSVRDRDRADPGDCQIQRAAEHDARYASDRRATPRGRPCARHATWPSRNVASEVPVRSPAAPARRTTAIFAHSTGSRVGTTVSDVRIMPLPYSPDTTSTARVPSASCARIEPIWLRAATSRASPDERCVSAAAAAVIAMPMPTVSDDAHRDRPPGGAHRAQLGPLRARWTRAGAHSPAP